MELPPDPGGDKGFFTEGTDVTHGKRKSTLTDVESVKAQRLLTHARRAGTPEPRAKWPPGPFFDRRFEIHPGGDMRRLYPSWAPPNWTPPPNWAYLGPGPYMDPVLPRLGGPGHPWATGYQHEAQGGRPSTVTGNDPSTLCVIS